MVASTLAVVVAGCGAAEPPNKDTSGEPALGQVSTLKETFDLVLPLDAFRATAEQEATINTANDMLIQECMRRFGFERPVAKRPITREPNRRYGISASDDYPNWGYHPSPEQFVDGKNAPENKYKPSDAEWEVITGSGSAVVEGEKVPEGGCLGEAGRALDLYQGGATSRTAVDDFVQKLTVESNVAARADSRVLAAWSAWSTCMDEAGFDYATPWDANDDEDWWTEQTPTEDEITTANADVACKEKTNTIGINLAVEAAYQDRLVERNAETLNDLRTRLATRVKRATEIASGN
ncbi:hypothetical protein [Actinokineospora globicatena]|uniref:hypothetical protein n=1 Tax=Actinokineospora globicatena TaxID=103729 RepID=UPI0020A33DD9|nr:hypothetical protein [Actinokineospora globicatena]MCP2302907.1 hypothetical protein [Actinokineospora globicatena]GLW78709.1 hypothetical protein Aglo01_31910 [Actinokineospora globicatena]GLW84623.1 hypothetical protein Aglo02_22630 [Actinokineospora globicatena]